jgi:hypothetical protein
MKITRYLLLLGLVCSLGSCSKDKDDHLPIPPVNLYPVSFVADWGGQYTFEYNAAKKFSRLRFYYENLLEKETDITYTHGRISEKTTTTFDVDGIIVGTQQSIFTHNASGRLVDVLYFNSSGHIEEYTIAYDLATNTYSFVNDDGITVYSFQFSETNQVVKGHGSWHYALTVTDTRLGPFYNLKEELLPLYFVEEFFDLFFATQGLTGFSATFGANIQHYEIEEEVNSSSFVSKITTTSVGGENSSIATITYTEL